MFDGIILTDTLYAGRIRPLGAYSVANALRRQGHRILVIDFFRKFPLEELCALLSKFVSPQTLFLGYSSSLFSDTNTFISNNKELLLSTINDHVKRLNPKLKIIFGGGNSRAFVNFVQASKNNFGVDYIMHGYADTMIVDFVNNLKRGSPQVSNNMVSGAFEISYDTTAKNFDFRNTPHQWLPEDLIFRNECLPVEIARGCIFKCKFCAFPLLGKDPHDDSYIKSEETLLTEFKSNYDSLGTLRYVVTDDTFNERSDKIETMIRVRDKLKLDLKFVGYSRLELIARKKEQLPLLKELNFDGFFFGIESLHYPSAKSIGKGIRAEEVKETLYKIKDYYGGKVGIQAGFIVGLPHETPETFAGWSSWIQEKDCPIDYCTLSPLFLARNTHSESEFNRDPEKYGYIVQPDGSWKNSAWDQAETTRIAKAIMQELVQSEKQKMPVIGAASLTGLGLDFFDVVHSPARHVFPKLEALYSSQATEYIQRLKAFADSL